MPSPVYVAGVATTAMLVVAPVTFTVPLAQAPPANAEPPMPAVVPAIGRFDFTKASVAMLVVLSLAACVIAVAPLALPPMEFAGIVLLGKLKTVLPATISRTS